MSRPKNQLPRPVFASIAPHEYLVANLSRDGSDPDGGTRANGRHPASSRPFHIHRGALSQAHGSAVARLGRTRVVCGVRGEVLPVTNIPNYRPDNRTSEMADYDLLVPNLELATGSAPEFLPGGPPSAQAQVLSNRLWSLVQRVVDVASLRIEEEVTDIDNGNETELQHENENQTQNKTTTAYWALYIDVVFLSYDGNPFDAAWAAILAALRNTRLPNARWDVDTNQAVYDTEEAQSRSLSLCCLPCALTAVVCVEFPKKQNRQASTGAHWLLHDPDRLEERSCRESVTVVVDASTSDKSPSILSLSKSGGVLVDGDATRQLVDAAAVRWRELSEALN